MQWFLFVLCIDKALLSPSLWKTFVQNSLHSGLKIKFLSWDLVVSLCCFLHLIVSFSLFLFCVCVHYDWNSSEMAPGRQGLPLFDYLKFINHLHWLTVWLGIKFEVETSVFHRTFITLFSYLWTSVFTCVNCTPILICDINLLNACSFASVLLID